MKKKILVVSQHYWPETFRVTDICEGFVSQGFEVDVLCGLPNYPGGKIFKSYGFTKNTRQVHNGVNIIRVPEIPRGNNTNARILINYLSFPFFATLYLPFLARKKYDRVLVYQLSPVFMAFPGILFAKVKRIKLYMYICDFWPHSLLSIMPFKNKLLVKALTSMSYWHYKRADGVIGVFKGTQDRLISDAHIDKQKTLYIPQAAEKLYENEIHDNELKKRFEDVFTIVFAGSINPAQSFETVVGAVKILSTKKISPFKLVIVGDGMSKNWLVDEVAKNNLEKYFVFEGFKPVEEIPKYQTIADALLVALSRSPLFEYGIPAKIQSYFAAGKPVVGAMDGEGKRLINESGSGICVDSGDALGLAKAIESVIEMKTAERKKLGENSKNYHYKHFERDYNLNRLIQFVFNNKRIPDTEYPD